MMSRETLVQLFGAIVAVATVVVTVAAFVHLFSGGI